MPSPKTPYTKFNLSFDTLREANSLRLPQFKNAKGLPAHSEPDGSDWIPEQWSNAALGELGEAANILKKLGRGDYTLDERPKEFEGDTVQERLAKELADTITYVDLLAKRVGVNLGDAVASKFNEISRRVKAEVFIAQSGNAHNPSARVIRGRFEDVEHSINRE